MKHIRLYYMMSILLLCVCQCGLAENRLIESSTQKSKVYVYRLDGKLWCKLHNDRESFDPESYKNSCVLVSEPDVAMPELPRGNYISISGIGNEVRQHYFTVDTIYMELVERAERHLKVYDKRGNDVKGLKVKRDKRRCRYDEQMQAYNLGKSMRSSYITVDNGGVYHMLEYENGNGVYDELNSFGENVVVFFEQVGDFFSKLYWNVSHRLNYKKNRNAYNSFMVFSKPKYKPNEELKLKIYLCDRTGKPYNKAVNLKLKNFRYGVDTIFVKGLQPYNPGMYSVEVPLSEGLGLKLDNSYWIEVLRADGTPLNVTDYFQYEDYVLKGLRFSLTCPNQEFEDGDSVTLSAVATDINNLPVYGGRMELMLRVIDVKEVPLGELTTIQENVWIENFQMGDANTMEIVIPDSVFKRGSTMNYDLTCKYISPNEEMELTQMTLKKQRSKKRMKIDIENGMLQMALLDYDDAIPHIGKVTGWNVEGDSIWQAEILFPDTLAVPWYVASVAVSNEDGMVGKVSNRRMNNLLSCRVAEREDSVFMTVENPLQIAFSYRVYKNKRCVYRGYGTEMSYDYKQADKNGYGVELIYQYGGETHIVRRSLSYMERKKGMNLDVITEKNIYPGMESQLTIVATDAKDRPLRDVDITAWGYTNKFDRTVSLDFRSYNKIKSARFQKLINEGDLDASDWSWTSYPNSGYLVHELGIDTLTYFQFMNAAPYYQYNVATDDGSTLVIPYVVNQGKLYETLMLSIDNTPYYIEYRNNTTPYAFKVSPGVHNLSFRVYDGTVNVKGVSIVPGHKNYIAIARQGEPQEQFTVLNDKLEIHRHTYSEAEKKNAKSAHESLIKRHILAIKGDKMSFHKSLSSSGYTDAFMYMETGETLYPMFNMNANNISYNKDRPLYYIGPFPNTNKATNIGKVGAAYHYTTARYFLPIECGSLMDYSDNLLRITPLKHTISLISYFSMPSYALRTSKFSDMPYTYESLRAQYSKKLMNMVSNAYDILLLHKAAENGEWNNRLKLELDNRKDVLYILMRRIDNPSEHIAYGPNTKELYYLPDGNLELTVAMRDGSCYRSEVNLPKLNKGETHYYRMRCDTLLEGDSITELYYGKILNTLRLIHSSSPLSSGNVALQQEFRRDKVGSDSISLGVSGEVIEPDGFPVIGAVVMNLTSTNSVIANFDGMFNLPMDVGDVLQVSQMGYLTTQYVYKGDNHIKITLREDESVLEEVMVVGYSSTKRAYVGSANVQSALEGEVAGVRIRGIGSVNASTAPLYVVDGIPYDGDIALLDPSMIASTTVLKSETAVALYGSRAANGVILISTKAGAAASEPQTFEALMEMGRGYGGMRRNFNDVAFWQPRLKTDKNGIAKVSVIYPDDITQWYVNVVGIGKNRYERAQNTFYVNSSLPLSVELSVPKFAIVGDSLNAIAKINNYTKEPIEMVACGGVDGDTTCRTLLVEKYSVTEIPAYAQQQDSLSVSYEINCTSGYRDGEQREIPIHKPGLLRREGEFRILNHGDSMTYRADSSLGSVHVYANSSYADVLMSEIDYVSRYLYDCNEQMASKLSVLLSKAVLCKLQGKPFKDEKEVKALIGRLKKNRNAEGLWGWWGKSATTEWMSVYILDVLLTAEEAGYMVNIQKSLLSNYFTEKVDEQIALNQMSLSETIVLEELVLLKRLGAEINYDYYYWRIVQREKVKDLRRLIEDAYVGCKLGVQVPAIEKALIDSMQQSLLGNYYWNDNTKRRIPLPNRGSWQLTLQGYEVLKCYGVSKDTLNKISNYLFELRSNGYWTNTYMSASIVKLLADVEGVNDNGGLEASSLVVNGETITQLPYSATLDTAVITLKQRGSLPLFTTLYQENWDANPQPNAGSGMSITTAFENEADRVELQQGDVVKLTATVTTTGEGNYVQIEIPIPAGCGYVNKNERRGYEVHREYFYDRVVIFCERLPKGTHHFTVELQPRFKGVYTVNPAKVELMYFPTFSGNNSKKEVRIVEKQP